MRCHPVRSWGRCWSGWIGTACNGYQLVEVLQARQRQISWLQAELLADMDAMAHAYGGGPVSPPVRHTYGDEHVSDEIAFALSWTSLAADTHRCLAWALIEKAPTVYQALHRGRIDLPRARVIVDEVELLDEDQTAKVLDRILPDAPHDTTGRLRHKIRKLVLQINPDAVRQRHRKALDERDVCLIRHRDGTASLVGHNLPADRAVAAMDHLGRMATATKKAGDPNGTRFDDRDARTTAQIRADIFVDLLDGADPTIPANQGGAGALHPAPRKGVVNVTVELTTLMQLTEHPGELGRYGPIIAEMARAVTDRITEQDGRSAVWRFQLTHDGRLVHEGRLHYRPTDDQRAYVRARDKHCQAPGCLRPPQQSDIDHITAWEHHGPTIEDNMCVLCRRHHRAKHNGFRLYRTDFGLVWISPRGRSYPVSLGRELDHTQRRILQDLINKGEERKLRA